MSDQNLICVGAIAGSFGVRGEVRLKSFCANPEDIGTYTPLFSEKGGRSLSLKSPVPSKVALPRGLLG